MQGFRQIYGDNRIEDKVHAMLKAKYGALSVNDVSFEVREFRRKHPIKYAVGRIKDSLSRKVGYEPINPWAFLSATAETEWLSEKSNPSSRLFASFPRYRGQESTVVNVINERLAHPLVNDYVAEGIAANKLLQYLLLKKTEVADNLIPSVPVGMGITDELQLEAILSSCNHVVVKPILGLQGLGFKLLESADARAKYQGSRAPVNDIPITMALKDQGFRKYQVVYVEDFVKMNDFGFEMGVSILQPFIESQPSTKEDSLFSSIRAIVCNGRFIDAYKRVGSEPRVNFSQGAKAMAFEKDPDIMSLCEKVVEVLEREANATNTSTFAQSLYNGYFSDRGFTLPKQRAKDHAAMLLQFVLSLTSSQS